MLRASFKNGSLKAASHDDSSRPFYLIHQPMAQQCAFVVIHVK
jgi:hypothetical protein